MGPLVHGVKPKYIFVFIMFIVKSLRCVYWRVMSTYMVIIRYTLQTICQNLHSFSDMASCWSKFELHMYKTSSEGNMHTDGLSLSQFFTFKCFKLNLLWTKSDIIALKMQIHWNPLIFYYMKLNIRNNIIYLL